MKKLFLPMTILIAMNFSTTMHPMQGAASRTAAQAVKHYAKKGFAGLMTTLHWTIAAGPSFIGGALGTYSLIDEKRGFKNNRDVNDAVATFVKKEINDFSPQTELHGVKIGDTFGMISPIYTMSNHHIFVTSSVEAEIASALENNDTKTLNKWKGVLQHENNHLQKKDLTSKTIAFFSIPLVTHKSWNAVCQALPYKKNPTSCFRQLLKLPSGVTKFFINGALIGLLSRYQEQLADDNIKNDIVSLNGLKDFLQDIIEQNPVLLQNKKFRLNQKLFGSHPLLDDRTAKLDARIAALGEHVPEYNE